MASDWIAPDPGERPEPGRATGEREALEEWLEYHRATLLTKCAGLSSEQLKRRAVPPSALSLLGLVRHMVDVERWWFSHVGEVDLDEEYRTADNRGGDFNDLEAADAEADIDTLKREMERAREIAAGRDLDDVVPSRGRDRDRPPANVRWIYVHMIEEYARHNGHADLLRERIDGVTGD